MKVDKNILVKEVFVDGKRFKKNFKTKASLLNPLRDVLKSTYKAKRIHYTYVDLN